MGQTAESSSESWTVRQPADDLEIPLVLISGSADRGVLFRGRRYPRSRLVWLVLLVIFLLTWSGLIPTAAWGRERILQFRSALQLDAEGRLQVNETITVAAEGKQIRHGLFRDLPSEQPLSFGFVQRRDFTIQQVLLNGTPAPWHLEERLAGLRLYIGDPDRILPAGRYVFSLRYLVTGLLDSGPEEDGFLWPVTGHGWTMPIDRVSLALQLPAPVLDGAVTLEARSGFRLKPGPEKPLRQLDHAHWIFEQQGLSPWQGVDLAVRWRAGLLPGPGVYRILYDNRSLLLAGLSLLFCTSVYLFFWLRSKAGSSTNQGQEISPALAAYADRGDYDGRCFSAALVSLASQRQIRLAGGQSIVLHRLKAAEEPRFADEAALLRVLFNSGGDENDNGTEAEPLHLEGLGQPAWQRVRREHQRAVLASAGGQLFKPVGRILYPIGVLSLTLLSLAIYWIPGLPGTKTYLTMIIWLFGWNLALPGTWRLAVAQLRQFYRARKQGPLLGIGALLLIYLLVEMALLYETGRAVAPFVPFCLTGWWGVHWLALRYLRLPTATGRRIVSALAARRRKIRPIPSAGEEDCFPFAVALGLEDRWEKSFKQGQEKGEVSEGQLLPYLYLGPWGIHDLFATLQGYFSPDTSPSENGASSSMATGDSTSSSPDGGGGGW